jgi:hypothetical protein
VLPTPHAPALRPLSVGEILDRASSLYRGRFAPFVATALLVYGPLAAAQACAAAAGGVLEPLLPLLWCGATALLLGALTVQAGRAYMGSPAGPGQAVAAAGVRFPALLVVFVLTGVGLFLGLFGLFVGALIVWVLLFAAVPVVTLEGRGPLVALRRSTELAEGDWMRILLVLLVAFIIGTLPSLALGYVVDQADMNLSGVSRGIAQAASTLLNALTYPHSVAATVILYYDRRVRAEGLDVELAASALG